MNKEKVKKLGIWALAIFLFASHLFIRSVAHADEGGGWKQVYARSGDCRIAFPVAPQLMQQAIRVSDAGHMLTYDVYLAPLNDNSLCLLLVATYPVAIPKGQEMGGLEGLLRGIVGHNPDNKLVFAKAIQYRQHPAIDFLVQSSNSYFRGQALMVGNKLYLIAIEGRDQAIDEKSFSRFSQSFSLVP
jgi:hypothetical protein